MKCARRVDTTDQLEDGVLISPSFPWSTSAAILLQFWLMTTETDDEHHFAALLLIYQQEIESFPFRQE